MTGPFVRDMHRSRKERITSASAGRMKFKMMSYMLCLSCSTG